MTQINISITDPLVVDGLIEGANGNGTTAEAIAMTIISRQGEMYAELCKVGMMTSAAFMARFTPTEYGDVMSAAQTDPEIQEQLDLLISASVVNLYDPKVSVGLDKLVAAGLLTSQRAQQLLTYDRPSPLVS